MTTRRERNEKAQSSSTKHKSSKSNSTNRRQNRTFAGVHWAVLWTEPLFSHKRQTRQRRPDPVSPRPCDQRVARNKTRWSLAGLFGILRTNAGLEFSAPTAPLRSGANSETAQTHTKKRKKQQEKYRTRIVSTQASRNHGVLPHNKESEGTDVFLLLLLLLLSMQSRFFFPGESDGYSRHPQK